MTSPRDTTHTQVLTQDWPKVGIVQKKNHDPVSWEQVLTFPCFFPCKHLTVLCAVPLPQACGIRYSLGNSYGEVLSQNCYAEWRQAFLSPAEEELKTIYLHDQKAIFSLPPWDTKHTVFYVSNLISCLQKKSVMFLRITPSLTKPCKNSSTGAVRLQLSFLSLSLPYA